MRNNHFYKYFYSKTAEYYLFLIHCSGIFGGKINIGNTYENIKYGNLKKNKRTYHNEGGKG